MLEESLAVRIVSHTRISSIEETLMHTHHRVLWVLQWVFGLYFIAVGVLHFIVPQGLPDLMSWMYELDDNLHVIFGVAEILGGFGLILPGLTGIRPELTIAAAVGLLIVMLGAIIFHVGRNEVISIGTNVLNAVVMGYIAYGRWRLAPFGSSEPTTT
jgi:uncharacterized membrane protein